MKRIVVVGASLCGLRALETLRSEGYAGELVAIGEEPVLPYDRPPLSKQFLKGEWEEDKIALRAQGVEDLSVEWRLGERAERLDAAGRAVVLASGERVPYDAVLLATGSVARQLPIAGDRSGIHLLRHLAHARVLREELARAARVTVVGAGFIGTEVAASCHERGLEVTLVEPLAAPLIRALGPTLGDLVADRFREEGVDLRLGVGVAGFEGPGRVEAVRLADGKTLPTDLVIVGIGVRPATDWLADSGLDVTDGVLCDATGATALPGVFAAGDVARWAAPGGGPARRHEHWTHAVEQGVHVARRILHGSSEGLGLVPYVWSDLFEMRIAIAGEPAADDTMHVAHGSLEERCFLALFGRDDRLVGAVAFRRSRQLHPARRLIAEGASFADAVAANG